MDLGDCFEIFKSFLPYINHYFIIIAKLFQCLLCTKHCTNIWHILSQSIQSYEEGSLVNLLQIGKLRGLYLYNEFTLLLKQENNIVTTFM